MPQNIFLERLREKTIIIYTENKMFFRGKLIDVSYPFILLDTEEKGRMLINIKQINTINYSEEPSPDSLAGEL